MINRVLLTGGSLFALCGLMTGCSTASTSAAAKNKSNSTVTVHTDANGVPIKPYAYKHIEVDIIPSVSMKHVTNSFGYTGKAIAGANNTQWLPVSLVEQALKGAGMTASLTKQTLDLTVPKSIGVGSLSPVVKAASGVKELKVAVNGKSVAFLPWLKTTDSANSYIPDTALIKALSPVHIQMQWKPKTGLNPQTLYIGSPIYGLVTTVTTFSTGHGSSRGSGMTIVHKNNNWIPYDYITNSLDNAKYGIQVTSLNGFSGLEITVPSSIPVNMKNLPVHRTTLKNVVPIEINHHVVAYAHSMVPKFGPSTGYLSSAQVMGAIKRIGITMHWNKTDGTFTQWDIKEGAAK